MSTESKAEPQNASAATAQVPTPAVVTVVTAVASQVALITALLYFFGRVHTEALYNYFGVDASSLEFSTSDYVIGSLTSTLPPVIVCALAILAILAAVRQLDRAVDFIQQRPIAKRVTITVTALAITACLIIILNGISSLPTASYSRGYPLPIGVVGLAAAVGMARRLFADRAHKGHSGDPLWSMMMAAFALAGVLWITDLYAAAEGNREGRDRAATLRSPTSSDFVLYSVDRLAITGPGVRDDPITAADNRYHFQYSGLRLLIHTPHQYIVLPAYWQKGRDHVIVIPVGDSTRFDVIPH